MSFTYDDQIQPILSRFGLDHIARLGSMRIDWPLITALVERWRRETHTFHLPIGEMTPTLEDVCYLLGLPVDGEPITEISDDNWSGEVVEVFGEDDWDTFPPRRLPGTYHLNPEWLRRIFLPANLVGNPDVRPVLAPNSPPELVTRYAQAFMLDLFGSVMFPDHSGYLYSMFLPIIKDVDNPPQLSWATGMLAYLYRGLCHGSTRKTKEIAIPCLFLQIWAWTRFPIGRPQARYFEDGLGERPFGVRWVGEHHFGDVPRGSVAAYRRQFEELRQGEVNWTPYEDLEDQLPELCRAPNNKELFFYKGPLIWFWIVEGYTTRRVMRQFHKLQTVPPPLLTVEDNFHEIKHSGLSNDDWELVHAESIETWAARTQHIVVNDDAFDEDRWPQYMAWFNKHGMRTVFWRASTALNINEPQPLANVVNQIDRTYNPHGQRVQQNIIRNVTLASDAIGAIRTLTGEARAFARHVLRCCRGNIEDVNRGDVFDQFIANHNVQEEEMAIPEEENTQVNPADVVWLHDVLGTDYGNFLCESQIFFTQTQQLSQQGIWEAGGASGVGDDGAGPSTSAMPEPQTNYTSRYGRPARRPDVYTPSSPEGHGGARGRGRRGGRR
ncbi:hypothetical protein LUZ61_004428 [Rhynchospora tenuis]|uniref:Aminotransferase-like plant mobile domain-containing protein n=1 Tax=Rhynchospora tenuis TaxID=198213 RepID=A0AAD6ETK1_9POAL|nr:hypothetical protein LUZ61_004428 [Rhynchospora tenuis]